MLVSYRKKRFLSFDSHAIWTVFAFAGPEKDAQKARDYFSETSVNYRQAICGLSQRSDFLVSW